MPAAIAGFPVPLTVLNAARQLDELRSVWFRFFV